LEDSFVVEIAKRHSKGAAQVLMKYWIQQNIAVIPKSVNPERIRSNFDVSVAIFNIRIDMTTLICMLYVVQLFDFELSADDIQKLKALDQGESARTFSMFILGYIIAN